MNRQRRLNSRQRQKLLDKLSKLRGKKCWICGRKKDLVVDDIFNDGDYTTPGKQQILCRRCNTRKNPRGKTKILSSPALTTDDIEPKRITSAELDANRKAEPEFLSWLFFTVQTLGEISVKDAKNSGAAYVSKRIISISQQTVARYIDKHTSSEGDYVIEERGEDDAVIKFRSRQTRPIDPIDEKKIMETLEPKPS